MSHNLPQFSGVFRFGFCRGVLLESASMNRAFRRSFLGTVSVYLLLVCGLSARAGVGDLSQAIVNPAPQADDMFGYSVTTLGDLVLVGAPRDNGIAKDSGAAYLFDRNGTLLNTFHSPTPDAGDWFGYAVTTVGENFLIGSARDDTWATDSGAAYLFNPQGQLLTTFFSPNPTQYESFGASLSSVGTDPIIGAFRAQDAGTGAFDAGAAYLFSSHGALITTFENPTPAESDHFGYSLAGVGDRIVIGAFGDDDGARGAGSVYVYDREGTLVETINNPAPAVNDSFGASVAAWGTDRVLIGATLDDTAGPNSGTVYAFDLNGTLEQTFPNPDPDEGENYGLHVLGLDDHVVIGAHRAGDTLIRPGGAYVFDQNGNEMDWITPTGAGLNPDFGFALAALQGDIVIGAPLATAGGARGGAIYIVDGPGESASLAGDVDLDGDVDAGDFSMFKEVFGAATRVHGPGDFNGDGIVGVADFGWLKRNFGASLSGASDVPEPATLILVLLATIGLALLRRPHRTI
jgi:hypothetical protein